MHFKNYKDLRDDIVFKLPIFQERQFDLVVGLPRSGMVPAYILGLHLNTNVTDLNSFILNNELKSGHTRDKNNALRFPHDAQRILVIDDSISSGGSLKKDLALIPGELLNKVTTCAVYSDRKERSDVDLFCLYLPQPRVFEWNIFHRDSISQSCFDIDGVLCVDPTEEQNDDGEIYIDFILNAKPLFIPSYKVKTLVTSRLEKYRVETETWLKKYNVQYDNLVMLDLPSKEERQRLNAHGKHKADYYKSSDAVLFYESEYEQSIVISKASGKPVYCVDENIMIYPDSKYQLRVSCKKTIRSVIASLLPSSLKSVIKKSFNK